MAWPIPQFSKSVVKKAGAILAGRLQTISTDEMEWAFGVLDNWRACHGYPINTFQATLRKRLSKLDESAIVSQRLKRLPSIIGKLQREKNMQLSTMQDLGGLRAVVGSIKNVKLLLQKYTKQKTKHELQWVKDYIIKPKSDGYRSVHLIFKYANDIAPSYNGLLLELQIRTRLQHAWATAVETMGTFLGQALKARQGSKEWLDFFKITSCAFAHLERTPVIAGYEHLSKMEVYKMVHEAEKELKVTEKLKGFRIAMDKIDTQKGSGAYYLITLDSSDKSVTVTPYAKTHFATAIQDYAITERQTQYGPQKTESVLVAAGPITNLRKMYPNFFLDTKDFVDRIDTIIRAVSR